MKLLKIGSLEIPQRAGLDLEQSYEAIGGETIHRTINGTGIKQSTWAKLRTTISGGGWVPSGMAAIDFTSQVLIACIVPRAIICDASRVAVLPATRRVDIGYTPWAWALMPDGGLVNTPVGVVGNTATATAVTDAIGYQVLYYPLLTCWAGRPTESGSRGDASYRWELIAEEV